jgi:O-acetyl-ADP-ribose deacetylase (regulator of RNase III)
MNIRYEKGDATSPRGPGPKVIVHICNDAGKWGKGFVLAVSKRWPQPEQVYRRAFRESPPRLGDVQLVPVTDDITVANVIGQHNVRSPRSKAPAPISYPAVREGLAKVAAFAREHGAAVSMPRIGCGLAGGTWEEMEPIIVQTLCEQGVPVTVYDYE